MNLVAFCFGADLAVSAIPKILQILIKYPNFLRWLFHFHGIKFNTNRSKVGNGRCLGQEHTQAFSDFLCTVSFVPKLELKIEQQTGLLLPTLQQFQIQYLGYITLDLIEKKVERNNEGKFPFLCLIMCVYPVSIMLRK